MEALFRAGNSAQVVYPHIRSQRLHARDAGPDAYDRRRDGRAYSDRLQRRRARRRRRREQQGHGQGQGGPPPAAGTAGGNRQRSGSKGSRPQSREQNHVQPAKEGGYVLDAGALGGGAAPQPQHQHQHQQQAMPPIMASPVPRSWSPESVPPTPAFAVQVTSRSNSPVGSASGEEMKAAMADDSDGITALLAAQSTTEDLVSFA